MTMIITRYQWNNIESIEREINISYECNNNNNMKT